MTTENREVSIPINDTGDLLEHTSGVWGQFKVNERGYIGGVHPNEISGIAAEWVNACERALVGHKIARRFVEEHIITFDLQSLITLNTFMRSLGYELPYNDRLQIIEKSKKAFSFLENPSEELKLKQEDIDAAQLLVAKLDHYYQPREIKPPIK
jgi:hypothetical protein